MFKPPLQLSIHAITESFQIVTTSSGHQLVILVRERGRRRPGACGDEPADPGQLVALVQLGVAASVETDCRDELSFQQVETDQLALRDRAADDELVPPGGVSDV